MRQLARASEDEMVFAFLLAELASPRWGSFVHDGLGGNDDLVRHASLGDRAQNAVRRHALAAYRGYGIGTYLFAGFPADVRWSRYALSAHELADFHYANCEPFASLTGGSRVVRDGAANMENAPAFLQAAVASIEGEVRDGGTYPPLIAAGCDREGKHVLVEGHTRATAYVRSLPSACELEVILGCSAAMSGWSFW
jgi:hypothetical protein